MKPSLPLPFVVLLCVVSCCCVVSTSGVFAAAHEPHVDASLRGAPAKSSGVGPASPASSVLATNARSRAEFEALITKAGCDAIEFQRVGTQVDTDGAPVEGSGYLAPIVLPDGCVGCGLCETRWFRINARQATSRGHRDSYRRRPRQRGSSVPGLLPHGQRDRAP